MTQLFIWLIHVLSFLYFQVEEGLRQLLRLGFWKYFLMLDFNFIGNMFKSTGWGRRVEFLAMKNKIVAYALVSSIDYVVNFINYHG